MLHVSATSLPNLLLSSVVELREFSSSEDQELSSQLGWEKPVTFTIQLSEPGLVLSRDRLPGELEVF